MRRIWLVRFVLKSSYYSGNTRHGNTLKQIAKLLSQETTLQRDFIEVCLSRIKYNSQNAINSSSDLHRNNFDKRFRAFTHIMTYSHQLIGSQGKLSEQLFKKYSSLKTQKARTNYTAFPLPHHHFHYHTYHFFLFRSFDPENTGKIGEKQFRKIMKSKEGIPDDDVNEMLNGKLLHTHTHTELGTFGIFEFFHE